VYTLAPRERSSLATWRATGHEAARTTSARGRNAFATNGTRRSRHRRSNQSTRGRMTSCLRSSRSWSCRRK
jgi:hypothetical protein